MQRLKERISQVKFRGDLSKLEEPLITVNVNKFSINLNEIVGIYISNLIEVIYREP